MIFTSSFKPAGTKSARLSSSKFLNDFGGNGQNVSDHMRRLFIPRPGFRFVQNDLEGAEAVAVALYVAEGNFRELVRRKIKIHNFVCVKIFPNLFEKFFTRAEIDALTPQSFHSSPHYKAVINHCKALKIEYALAKRTVHGSNYSMGWKTFQENILRETSGRVVLTAAECKRLLNSYFDLFPEVKIFQATFDKHAQEFTTFENLFGWKVKCVQRYTTAVGRTCISWGPQSTVGVATVVAAKRFQDHIERGALAWNLLNCVHDSLLVEAPTEECDVCAQVLADCMHFEFTSPIDGWRCSIGVEKSIGKNWGKHDEKENPEGMKVS